MAGFTIHPTGSFDLAAAAGFGFGPTEGSAQRPEQPRMALAFCADDLRHHAGVELHQDAHGAVQGSAQGDADAAAVKRQVARIVSLDHDGKAWAAVGDRDPVIGRLQAQYPGQRPVLFHSAYEAAAWAVISARRPAAQGARVRDRLAQELGVTFELHGARLGAFPAPARLAGVEPGPGLPAVKADRLRAVARAALDGELDQAALAALDPEEAAARLQRLPGIGPFYALLVTVRSLGHADVPVAREPRTLAAIQHFYGLDGPPSDERLAELSEPWRPFRTWASVLLHSAGRRLGLTPART